MTLPDFNNLADFLKFLAGPGAAMVFILLASYFLEGWGKWDALAAKLKQLIFLGGSLVVGFIGLWLGNTYVGLPPEAQAQYNQLFLLIYSIGAYILVPQYVHRLTKPDKPATVVQGGMLQEVKVTTETGDIAVTQPAAPAKG